MTPKSFFLGLFSAVLALHAARPVSAQTAEQAYAEANALLLEGRWADASAAFAAFVRHSPGHERVDDAAYFRCTADDRLQPASEASFACFENFLRSYPRSNYAEAARTDLVRIGTRLADGGKPVYAERVRALRETGDEEVTLAAIQALFERDDPETLPLLLGLLDRSRSPEARVRLVYLLSEFDGSQVIARLQAAATSDPSTAVQVAAVRALSSVEGAEAAEALRLIVRGRSDADVLRDAIRALGQRGSLSDVPLLADLAVRSEVPPVALSAVYAMHELGAEVRDLARVARSARDVDTRRNALMALAERGDPDALAVLVEVATTSPEAQLRRTAVMALAEFKDDASVEALSRVARNDADTEVRRTAVQALGMIGSPAARAALRGLVGGEE